MKTKTTKNRFGFVRDRVFLFQYSSSGELLVRAGAVKEVEHDKENKQTRILCENALIIASNENIIEYDADSEKNISINCKEFKLQINGKNAEIELKRLSEFLDLNIGNKRKNCASTSREQEKTNDVFGYYSLLGVSAGCTRDEIKKAYKKRCLEVHPDLNDSADAHESFINLQNAYEILSNAQKRAEYDSQCVRVPNAAHTRSDAAEKSDSNFEPIRCSQCNCVSAQPRYVVFWEVFSLWSTLRAPVQGVMCTKCAGNAAYKATLKSLVFGWWGIWGLISTPISVLNNLSGGEKPSENNGRILLHQSWFFAQNNRPDLAYLLALEASSFIRKSPTNEKDKLLSICDAIINECKQYAEGKSLNNAWSKSLPRTTHQWIAIGICGAAWIMGLSLLNSAIAQMEKEKREGAPNYAYETPQNPRSTSPPPVVEKIESVPDIETPILPTYLPLSTGYLPNTQIKDGGGKSQITLRDKSGRNFHVKLYRRLGGTWAISRELYLKAYEEFKINELKEGKYEIRRMDIQTKSASKTQTFELEETETLEGVTYTVLTITLNSPQGNSKITPISAKDF